MLKFNSLLIFLKLFFLRFFLLLKFNSLLFFNAFCEYKMCLVRSLWITGLSPLSLELQQFLQFSFFLSALLLLCYTDCIFLDLKKFDSFWNPQRLWENHPSRFFSYDEKSLPKVLSFYLVINFFCFDIDVFRNRFFGL